MKSSLKKYAYHVDLFIGEILAIYIGTLVEDVISNLTLSTILLYSNHRNKVGFEVENNNMNLCSDY